MPDDDAQELETETPQSPNGEAGLSSESFHSNPLRSVPIEVTVMIGKAQPKVSDFVRLRRDSVLTLNSRIDDPVEIYVGDRLIARGDLQELGDDEQGRLAVRLTEVADLSDGV